MKLRRIAVAGVGLLGGSVALAVRRRFPRCRVVGIFRRAARARLARRRGIVDEASLSPAEGCRGCGIVVVCTPVEEIGRMLRRIRPGLAPDAVVMDVGSVKAPVLAQARRALGSAYPRFIGCHPMAGSERTGFEHARADLFRGRSTAITPDSRTLSSARRAAGDFWRALGASPLEIPAPAHDRIVASTSHLPHLAASAVASAASAAVPRSGRGLARSLVAEGFRDTTRVAGSDPRLWAQILRNNSPAVRASLRLLLRYLRRASARLSSPPRPSRLSRSGGRNGGGGLEFLLREGRRARRVLCG